MADVVLEVRVVDQAGAVGRKLGELRRSEAGRVTVHGDVAGSILARTARVTGGSDVEAFDLLAINGWSNAHLTLVSG